MRCGEDWSPETVFLSSGTTGQIPSQHQVRDLALYRRNVMAGFRAIYPAQRYRIFALLPSYLERGHSSLVYMVKVWMEEMGLPGADFYLDDTDRMRLDLRTAIEQEAPILIIGVAYALLDFVAAQGLKLPADSLVIETGGMKGRKKEMLRSDLHARLCAGFGVERVHSEYGMTELLSQAYTGPTGRFVPAPTLRVRVSDIHLDRLNLPLGQAGRLHLIDYANLHSCAFIATDDLGRLHPDGSFEVLGRLDTAEIRGCSLMYR